MNSCILFVTQIDQDKSRQRCAIPKVWKGELIQNLWPITSNRVLLLLQAYWISFWVQTSLQPGREVFLQEIGDVGCILTHPACWLSALLKWFFTMCLVVVEKQASRNREVGNTYVCNRKIKKWFCQDGYVLECEILKAIKVSFPFNSAGKQQFTKNFCNLLFILWFTWPLCSDLSLLFHDFGHARSFLESNMWFFGVFILQEHVWRCTKKGLYFTKILTILFFSSHYKC